MFTFTVTSIVFWLSLLASQTVGAPNGFEQSKHVGWTRKPRTLQNPAFVKRDELGGRDVGVSPLDNKDIFRRQGCTAGQVTCPTTMGCCPAGYNCTDEGGCCPVGHTCLPGPPSGDCADPNSVECPAGFGGCCPVGEPCSRDSTGVGYCDTSGLSSSSRVVPTTTYTPPTPTLPPSTSTPTPTTSSVSSSSSAVTTTASGNGGEKMGTGMGALAVMMSVLVFVV